MRWYPLFIPLNARFLAGLSRVTSQGIEAELRRYLG